MRMQYSVLISVVIAYLSTGCTTPHGHEGVNSVSDDTQSLAANAVNPFMNESSLDFNYPPFDKINDEHYLPAFELAMSQHLQEIESIASQTDTVTFENTLLALERSGRMLDRVQRVFFALTATNTNDQLGDIRSEITPKLAAHSDKILLDDRLFKRIQTLNEQKEDLNLDAESQRLIHTTYLDFVHAGAELSDDKKERMREINTELAGLQTTFTKNVLKEVNELAIVVESKEQLSGLSDTEIAATAAEAKNRELQGKYVIALKNTSGQPSLSSLTNRALRERIHKTSLSRGSRGGEFDNREILASVLKLRAERAVLLGYENHASYMLDKQTAKTTSAVNSMLNRLVPAAVSNAKQEAEALQKMIAEDGHDFDLASWDWAFYSEKQRQAEYNFDAAALKPYLELNSVLENGVFFMAEKLYGLSFKRRTDLPTYHPDVQVYEVFEQDGTSLALFITDFYARSSKRGGAWMNSYVSQSELLGSKPVVANHLNIPKPPAGEPTLMTFTEVNTLFHEFGHALHGMFSDVKYPSFSGTSVPRDFVEYPSQVHEMWVTWPEILENYAIHYKTGEPLPKDLLDKVMATKTFNQGFATTEYLAASVLDQAYHQLPVSAIPSADTIIDFESKALSAAGIDFAPVPPRYRSTYFSHIIGGYSAGYYSYIWSEVLDADTVEWFEENGGLSLKNGRYFREKLLSKGGSVEAMELFKGFRGQEPNIDYLLVRRGLK